MQEQHCPMNIVMTENFLREWSKLMTWKQERARQKIALLAENCRHPSLRTHQLHHYGKWVWGCSLSKTERLVYLRRDSLFILHSIGKHDVVETAHIRPFSVSELRCFFCTDSQ